MNINDDDIDLGLALGSTYYSAQTRLNRSSGAGVNADSRVGMAFAASDPLTELVWSPHSGLKLKCADSIIPNTKSIQLWNVGLNIKNHSTSRNIRSEDSGDDKVVDGEKLTISHTMLEADGNLCGKASMLKYPTGKSKQRETEGETHYAIQEEDIRDQGKGPLSLHNGQIAEIIGCGKMNAEQDAPANHGVNTEMKWDSSSKISRSTHSNLRSRLEFGASNNDIFGSADPVNSKPHAAILSEIPVCSLQKVASQQEEDDEVMSSSGDVDMVKIRKPIAIPLPNLTILESSAENDSGSLAAKECHSPVTRLQRENSCPVDKSPTESRIRLYQEKGKAKALPDGDIHRRPDEEDGGNDSMESCSSTGLLSKGIKRQSTDQEQLVESKRLKKQIQVSHCSTSLVRPDSSFMNWISNMVKGLSDSNKEGSSSLALTLARSNDICDNNRDDIICNKHPDCENPKVGFQSMFQSLYARNAKMPISGVQQDNCSIHESGELMVADKTGFENAPYSSNKSIDKPCKQMVLCNTDSNQLASRKIIGNIFSKNFSNAPCVSERNMGENKASLFPICDRRRGDAAPFGSLCKRVNGNADDTVVDSPLPIRCLPSKGSPLSSLWITRLYNKAAKLETCHQVTEEVPVYSTEFSKPYVEFKSTNKPSSEELTQTSEKMASEFAKRLDAFRHIIHPSEVMKSPAFTQICFFCGRSSHDLRTCPDLTEAELDDLLVKISAFERVGQSPSFCIKCFQFDHWASSCPSVSLQRHGCSQQKICAGRSSCHIQLCPLVDCGDEDDRKEVSIGLTAANDSYRKMLLTSSVFQRTATNSDDDLKNMPRFPSFDSISAQNRVAGGEMLHVIAKLRLSRGDVLRWMDSNVSLSNLNGFFLRLRLGSSEAGLAGTGYYAARITGDKMEGIDCKSKKSILVDVGGIKSSVGSQYVSNRDFLEDEIKAWWSRLVKTGGSIPSLDELNSKFEQRKCLGF